MSPNDGESCQIANDAKATPPNKTNPPQVLRMVDLIIGFRTGENGIFNNIGRRMTGRVTSVQGRPEPDLRSPSPQQTLPSSPAPALFPASCSVRASLASI